MQRTSLWFPVISHRAGSLSHQLQCQKKAKKLFFFCRNVGAIAGSMAGGEGKNQAQGFFFSFLLCFLLLVFYCYLKERGDFQLHTEKTHCLACGGFLCLLEWKITHRHNTEKYYCQRFPEMPSRSPSVLPRREAVGCFSVFVFVFFLAIVPIICNIVHLQRTDAATEFAVTCCHRAISHPGMCRVQWGWGCIFSQVPAEKECGRN